MSISYARDFTCQELELKPALTSAAGCKLNTKNRNYERLEEAEDEEKVKMTNVDGVYATKNVKKGRVVLYESELPDCELPCETYLLNLQIHSYIITL